MKRRLVPRNTAPLIAGCAIAALLLNGCAPSSPAEEFGERTTQFFAEHHGSVASVVATQERIQVTVREDGQWVHYDLYPELVMVEGGSDVPVLEGEFPDLTEHVRALAESCEQGYELRVRAVSDDVLHTTEMCGDQVRGVSLSGATLPSLTGGWSPENLHQLWEELTLVTSDQQVERLQLNEGVATVEILPTAGPNEDCRLQWNRNLVNPEDSATLCLPARTQAGAIDLGKLTADDVAGVIQAAGSQGISDPMAATIDIASPQGFPVVTVIEGSRRWSQEFLD